MMLEKYGTAAAPGDKDADQNGDTAGQSDQITRAEQGQRKAHRQLENGVARFEPVAGAVGNHAQAAGQEAHQSGQQPARQDFAHAAVAALSLFCVFMFAAADF